MQKLYEPVSHSFIHDMSTLAIFKESLFLFINGWLLEYNAKTSGKADFVIEEFIDFLMQKTACFYLN